jgi:hypothetical protein
MTAPARLRVLATTALALAALAAGCGTAVDPGQFTCQKDAPGSCPPGWLCQCRGAGCEWRCWQDTASYCGDGVRDEGEDCDGADFGGQTCQSLGRGDGFMWCRSDCTIACTACGNGEVEATPSGEGESCDLGPANSDAPNAACRSDCQPQRCGDGVRDDLDGEECDPGDATHEPDLAGATCETLGYYGGTLSCLSNCRLSVLACDARCGDGVRNGAETCDGNDFGDDTCTARGYYGGRLRCSDDCTAVFEDQCAGRCGDGTQDAFEACDPGDGTHPADLGGATCESLGYHPGTLACRADCHFDPTGCGGRCGDGLKDPGEACDPGDGSLPADLGGQSCGSLGYYAGTLACLSNCQLDLTDCRGQCGDGVKNGTEACDGNDFGDDTCTARGFYGGTLHCSHDCRTVDTNQCAGRCGDGTLDTLEVCDPGDANHPAVLGGATCGTLGYHPGTLGCRSDCRFDLAGCGGRCGDGVKDPTEQCDGADLGTPAADCGAAGYYFGALACGANCQYDVSGCSGRCGDGIQNGAEACDTYDFGALTCRDFESPAGPGFNYYAGYLTCSACTTIDTGQCHDYCGDGVRNGSEVCDGADLDQRTCQSFAYYSGTLGCAATCDGYDTSLCLGYCGDGAVNGGGAEQCDGLAQGGLSCVGFGYEGGSVRCSSYCLPLTDMCTRASWKSMTSSAPIMFAVNGNGPNDVWMSGQSGTLLHYDGATLSTVDAGTTTHLRGVWAGSPTNVWAVGDGGTVRRWDGTSWTGPSPGTAAMLTSVWGLPSGDVWAAGQTSGFKGTVAHWDGAAWTVTTLPPNFMGLNGVWASAPNDVFVVGLVLGGPTIWRYNGSAWSSMALPGGLSSGTNLYGISGTSASDVWVVGDSTVLHYDGTAWSLVATPTVGRLKGVSAVGAADVWVVGENGTMAHYDGTTWRAVDSGTTTVLNGVWGSGPGDVFAVGWNVVLHYQAPLSWSTAQTMNAVGGRSQSDLYAVGNAGAILHYDGTQWQAMTSHTTANLAGVWASPNTADVYAVGAIGGTGYVVHYDGATWSEVVNSGPANFAGVWGSGPLDVFAVGGQGLIYHYDGSWHSMPNPMAADTGSRWLTAVWGTGPTNVYAVGERSSGLVSAMRYDGASWTAVSIGNRLRGIWGTGPADIYAVGYNGGVFHFDGAQWTAMSVGVSWAFHGVWGTDPANVFAAGEGLHAVMHFDGTVWSPLDVGATPLLSLWGAPTGQAFATSGGNAIVRFATTMPRPEGGACTSPIVAYCGTAVATSSLGRAAGPTSWGAAGSECVTGLDGHPVYYRFDSPLNGSITVTLAPTEHDLDLVVLAADSTHGCDVTQCVAASQHGGLTSETLTIPVVAGQTYYLVVDGPGAGGAYGLTLGCTKQ